MVRLHRLLLEPGVLVELLVRFHTAAAHTQVLSVPVAQRELHRVVRMRLVVPFRFLLGRVVVHVRVVAAQMVLRAKIGAVHGANAEVIGVVRVGLDPEPALVLAAQPVVVRLPVVGGVELVMVSADERARVRMPDTNTLSHGDDAP